MKEMAKMRRESRGITTMGGDSEGKGDSGNAERRSRKFSVAYQQTSVTKVIHVLYDSIPCKN